MKRRPEFAVVAGPNGAGKSRLCPFYVSTVSFDGDKLAMQLKEEHPNWPERWIHGTVVGELEKQKNKALENYTDFAFETNFSSDIVVRMIEEFKKAGFKVTLYYFGLSSVEESISRVIHRANTGGHDVTEDIVRYNFTEGIKRTKENLHLFENITFIDGNSPYGNIIAIHIDKNHTHNVSDNTPKWFKEQFQETFNSLKNL